MKRYRCPSACPSVCPTHTHIHTNLYSAQNHIHSHDFWRYKNLCESVRGDDAALCQITLTLTWHYTDTVTSHEFK